MSIKTIAVDVTVYEKLAKLRRGSESFSKAMDRLISKVGSKHTGADILADLSVTPSALTNKDATVMAQLVDLNRKSEKWPVHDLR